MEKKDNIRGLSLLSGGLDSQLAVCVLKAQGLEIHGITFVSPFFGDAAARKAAAALGIPLHVVEFTEDILSLVKKPPHGFGGEMNPCIDCHGRMLMRAGEMAEREGFHFLSTGEVLNERPMSQNRRSLDIVAGLSGRAGRILRPLSAKLLPETEPEQKGWVDRAQLLDLHGRSRKRQFELARQYGLRDYPTPAGGCLLTEPNFAQRLKDLKEHEGLDDGGQVRLLRFGRHLRLPGGAKIIVGRQERDNRDIEVHAPPGSLLLRPVSVPGPTCLLPGSADEATVRLGAEICAAYSDHRVEQSVTVEIVSPAGARRLDVVPADREGLASFRI